MRNCSASLGNRRPSVAAGVAELDVTPVMNMFIILIPFLISMTAFSHLAAHELSLPGNEAPAHAAERSELPLTVGVGLAGLLLVQGDIVLAELPRRGSDLDLAGLTSLLHDRLGGNLPVAMVLAVDDPVLTAEVVACLDACREAGWTDVALAAGTGVVLSGEVKP